MKKWIPLFFLMTGCQTLQDNPYISPFLPKLQFDRLQVNYIDFQEIDTEFVFSVDNPNPIGIDIEEFSYGLSFANVEWISGDNPDGLLLNAMNISEVSLPAELVFADLYDMVQTARGQDSLPFRLDGDFGVSLETMLNTSNTQQVSSTEDILVLPYDVSGDFPALRRPRFSLQQLQLQELSLSNIKFDVILDVDNEHASNLIFQRFSYDLDLGGNSVISGIADNLDIVVHGSQDDDKANRTLRIPVEIDTFSSVSQIWNILSSRERLDIGFSAISDVDTPFGLVELHIDEVGDIGIDLH